jgi:hypothetical protein
LSLSSQNYGFGIRKKPVQDPGSGTLHGQNLSSTSGEPEIVAQQFQPQVAGRWGHIVEIVNVRKKIFCIGLILRVKK